MSPQSHRRFLAASASAWLIAVSCTAVASAQGSPVPPPAGIGTPAPAGSPLAGGITWSPLKDFASDERPTSLASDGTSFVMVGNRGDAPFISSEGLAWSSTDGTTWTPVALPGAKNVTSIAVGPTAAGYVALGVQHGKGDPKLLVWRSTDSTTWTPVTTSGLKSANFISAVPTADGFAASGQASFKTKGRQTSGAPALLTSPDGVTWRAEEVLDPSGHSFPILLGRVAVSPAGTFVTGVDFSGQTDYLLHSTGDGRWAEATLPEVVRLLDLAATATGVAALGVAADGLVAYTSADGQTWERSLIQAGGHTGQLAQAGDGLVVVGDGAVATSADGEAWTTAEVPSLAGLTPTALSSLPDGRLILATQDSQSASSVWLGAPAP